MTSASDPAERQVLICRPAFQDSQQLLHRYHSRSELVRQMLKLRWWDPDRPRVLDLAWSKIPETDLSELFVDDAFGISASDLFRAANLRHDGLGFRGS